MLYKHIIILSTLLLLMLPGKQVSAQKASSVSSKTEVMVLGTFHFSQTGDSYDILSPEKQNELEEVVNSLANFQPNKIAIEALYKDSTTFDSLYNRYKNGEHTLNRNERQQLGFRLAKLLDHPTIYSIDFKQPWPYGEVMSWAKDHQPEFISFYDRLEKRDAQLSG